jgi:hypothetical protein
MSFLFRMMKAMGSELPLLVGSIAENMGSGKFNAFPCLAYCRRAGRLGHVFKGIDPLGYLLIVCRGLPRKIVRRHLVRPSGLNQVEYLMTEYVKKHGLLGRKDKFYQSTVLEWLKKNVDAKITEELVKEYLDYWSLVGAFFIYSDPYVALSSIT